MKKIIAIFLALLVCACAKRQPPVEDASAELLASRWLAMLNAEPRNGPYREQLSLRFGTEGDTRRVTAILWGNNDAALRLDVMAGVGATVAKIMEDGDNFLVYAPREGKAYFHQGASSPLLRAGVPVPFTLGQLAALLNGRFAAIFGEKYSQGGLLANGAARFELEGRLKGSLELDEKGLPVGWRQARGGWSLTLAYDEAPASLPRSLRLANANGQRAILLVKEREHPEQPFTAEQMELKLPPETPVLPFSKFKKS